MSCLNRLAGCIAAIVVLLVLLLAALYFYGLSRLDTMLADAVRREYMLPPDSEVTLVYGSIFDTLEGQVKRFAVHSDQAKLDGLVVEDMEFLAEGIRFDLPRTFISGQAELKEVANGELSLRVSEEALEERWAEELKSKGLSDVNVELREGEVKVSAEIDLKLTKVRLGARGKLGVDGSDRIRFEMDQLDVQGMSVDVSQFKAVFSKLTPVIDLGQFKMSVAVDKLQPREGYLEIDAHSISLEQKLALDRERREAEEKQRQAEEPAEKDKAEQEGQDKIKPLTDDAEVQPSSDGEGNDGTQAVDAAQAPLR